MEIGSERRKEESMKTDWEGADRTKKSMRVWRCLKRQRRDRGRRVVEVSRMCSFPCGLFAC